MFIHGQSSTTDVKRDVELTEERGVSSTPASPNDGVIEIDEDFTITQDDEDSTFVVDTSAGNVTVAVDPAEFPLNEHFKVQVVNDGANNVTFSAISGTISSAGTTDEITAQNGHVTVRHLTDGDVLLYGDIV